MSFALGWFFVAAAAVALASAAMLLWLSLRASSANQTAFVAGGLADRRLQLLAEKDSLLRDIAELKFEHESNKLSDEDFASIEKKLRARAKAVLRQLDIEIAPHRAQAEKLIAEHLGGGSASLAADEPSTARLICGACQASNEPDATFCKGCGGRLSTPSESEIA